jgi:hypothetical protein
MFGRDEEPRRFLRQQNDQARNGVRNVVSAAGRMVDIVAIGAAGIAFERAELRGQARQVGQLDLVAVERGERVNVKLSLRFRCQLVFDAVLVERLRRPFAAVFIANNSVAVVAASR